MEKNQEYAIIKDISNIMWGRAVKELKSNGRAELEPFNEQKTGPIHYYHSLHSIEDGEALLKKYFELVNKKKQKEILLESEFQAKLKELFP